MDGYRISMDVLTKGDGRKWIKKSICQKKRERKASGTQEKKIQQSAVIIKENVENMMPTAEKIYIYETLLRSIHIHNLNN